MLINENYKEIDLFDAKNDKILVYIISLYKDYCLDCKQFHDFKKIIPLYITDIFTETHEKYNIQLCKGYCEDEEKFYNFKDKNIFTKKSMEKNIKDQWEKNNTIEDIDDPNDEDEVPEWD